MNIIIVRRQTIIIVRRQTIELPVFRINNVHGHSKNLNSQNKDKEKILPE